VTSLTLAVCRFIPHFDAARLPTSLAPRSNLVQTRSLERAKQFFFRYFERIFVILLVASLLGINYLIDEKFAFLSFYYLPIILAGFFGGRRFAVFAGVFVVALVFFFQMIEGLGMEAGLTEQALVTLIPWAGFLILTGYVVGGLAEQRASRLADLKNAYVATLEVLTFHIETTEWHQQGHSNRVADRRLDCSRDEVVGDGDRESADRRVAARSGHGGPATPQAAVTIGDR